MPPYILIANNENTMLQTDIVENHGQTTWKMGQFLRSLYVHQTVAREVTDTIFKPISLSKFNDCCTISLFQTAQNLPGTCCIKRLPALPPPQLTFWRSKFFLLDLHIKKWMNMGPCYVLTVKLKVQVKYKPLPT